jgi:outer membrane protein
MKKNSLRLVLVTVLVSISAFAQAQLKFGHINSTELIQMMPQTKQADSTLKKEADSYEQQLRAMTAEYQSKLQSYQRNDSMPDAIRAMKEKELQDLGQRIQEFQQTAQESMQKRKEEIYTPILKKAEDAIKDIAKEKGYAYIFDTSPGTGAVLYAQPSDNIMDMVKTRLNLK